MITRLAAPYAGYPQQAEEALTFEERASFCVGMSGIHLKADDNRLVGEVAKVPIAAICSAE